MKIPSITVLTNGLITTLRRWPLSILLAIVTSILLMRVNNDYSGDRERLWTIIYSGYTGMLLTIAATIIAERRGWRVGGRVLVQGLAVALAVGFYFWLPVEDVLRTISLLVVTFALHCVIAFLPYGAPADGPVGFWDYNRKLFLRALQTALYTLVLWAGIWLALEAIEHLFGIEFHHAYTNTWWTLAGIFNPIFFLAGFPRTYAKPDTIDDYPRGLKVFTQYVLLPIITIYLAILYAYLFKIVFTAHWPSGWVAYLVLGFSVAGILALLLVWPLRNEEGNRWVRSYSRFFYLALVPLIVLLWVAIWKRSHSYGVTEARYYVVLLAAWLSGIACYFIFSRRKDIRLIPASLSLLALLSLWGPWGASGMSLSSQMGRMRGLLQKDGLLADGKIVPAKGRVPLEDRKQVSSIMEYIISMHGYRVLQPLFRPRLDSVMEHDPDFSKGNYWSEVRIIMPLLGFEYIDRFAMEEIAVSKYYQLQEAHPAIRMEGVHYMIPGVSVDASEGKDSTWTYYFDGMDSVGLRIDSGRHELGIFLKGMAVRSVIDLRPLEHTLGDSLSAGVSGNLQMPMMTIGNSDWRMVVTTARTVAGVGTITHLEGYLLGLGPRRE